MKRGRGGVEYEDIRLGDGPSADRGMKVDVRYSLFLDRGRLVQENQEYSFRVGKRRVIPGAIPRPHAIAVDALAQYLLFNFLHCPHVWNA